MKWLRRGAWTLLMVVLFVAAALWIYSRRVLPITKGTLVMQGPHAEVSIARDANGIPTIKAASRDDAMFGLGYAHAQDRLARMAARRAFVEMKTCFMRAAADIDGNTGALLQRQVRMASEVIELWRLRHALLSALPAGKASSEMHRQELMQQIDSAFPEGEGHTAFLPL